MEEEVSFKMSGNCFEANGKVLIGLFIEDKSFARQHFLCHGIVIGQEGTPVEGQEFTHGWLELGDVVFDHSNGKEVVMRKELYYEAGEIKNIIRYTGEEAIQLLYKTQHYGPWDKKLVGFKDGMVRS